MRALVSLFALAVLFAVQPALAGKPAFDPRSWKGAHAGPPTQVLTLGSDHLARLPKPLAPEMLAPLLDRLAAFKPEIITHEGISGEQCDVLKRYAVRYPGMFDTYCFDTDAAEKATGLNVAAALAAVETTLAAWPASPTAAQRRRLASLFLAANDRPSAQVQWRKLAAGEQKAGDGVDAALLAILTKGLTTRNETYAIGVPLAVRLGLERMYAVDDHTADSVQALAGPGLDPYLQKHWSSGRASPISKETDRRAAALASGNGWLDYYRFLNRPTTQRAFIEGDYKDAMNAPSPENFGRIYVAWWEVRNLRMVANIRAAFGNKPGARVLNIVGASHKPYYDAYLDMMSDVRVVDAATVLR